MFKDRLKERMKQKGFDTKKLAKSLCNYGSDTDLWEDNSHKSSYMRKIQKWKAGTSEPANLLELKKICDILDCDISYLLDATPMTNLNNKKVADYLGLDEIVISKIKNYDDSIKLFMQLLVRGDETEEKLGDILYELLSVLYDHRKNSAGKIIIVKDRLTEECDTLNLEKSCNYVTAATINALQPIFDKITILGYKITRIALDNKFEADMRKREKDLDEDMHKTSEITGKSEEEIRKELKIGLQRKKGYRN